MEATLRSNPANSAFKGLLLKLWMQAGAKAWLARCARVIPRGTQRLALDGLAPGALGGIFVHQVQQLLLPTDLQEEHSQQHLPSMPAPKLCMQADATCLAR